MNLASSPIPQPHSQSKTPVTLSLPIAHTTQRECSDCSSQSCISHFESVYTSVSVSQVSVSLSLIKWAPSWWVSADSWACEMEPDLWWIFQVNYDPGRLPAGYPASLSLVTPLHMAMFHWLPTFCNVLSLVLQVKKQRFREGKQFSWDTQPIGKEARAGPKCAWSHSGNVHSLPPRLSSHQQHLTGQTLSFQNPLLITEL